MHVRLSTERLDQDEKFRELVTRFVDAKLELVEYLNSKMDFAFEREVDNVVLEEAMGDELS